ncbi:SIR2 family protein [Arthrobacter sp. AQ5-05]|uniref:SIR2 family NAD-dependent protein deacylase n=1 Tax=Arthrobacter sp. AQ5-05 TaxID=2184581 RepID=UPI0015EBF970|nr:SIR2 family protein [Arthrobacter sp. AQ5-05]
MNEYLERLRFAVADHTAVVVAGTGVSKSLSSGAPTADWVGLIRNGIERAARDIPKLDAWQSLQEISLEHACTDGDTDDLINVASAVATKLKKHSPQLFSDWLRESVGLLPLTEPALAQSLGTLGLPILTTNYDTLIEQALGLPSVTWRDPEAMRELFKGESRAVGHLHGIFDRPDSVILSDTDYSRILMDNRAQFVQQAHYATKSFIYVGYGSGLDDPNFSKLLEWHSRAFPESRGDHFRLCKNDDVQSLSRQHAQHDIRVVGYGDEYSDLTGFLNTLVPEAANGTTVVIRDNLAYAREAITEQVRQEMVVAAEIDDIDERDLNALTVPPVLLPYSHEQFASMQAADDETTRPKRIDPHDVHGGSKILIVVGDEHSGLTTALRWIVAQTSYVRENVAPIYIDARHATSPNRPLSNLVVRESLSQRLIDSRRDELPPYILAVDNLTPNESLSYKRSAADLLSLNTDFIVVGCKQGLERELARDLSKGRLEVETCFMGKLSRSDIMSFAEIIAPQRAEDICDGVLDVIRREYLPRNPFTVSLLISLFVQARSDQSQNSETAVLNDYVQLLLGRNGPVVDARMALSLQNRETVLAELAKHFVRNRKGALTHAQAIETIQTFFVSVQWKEDPTAVFENFRAIRVLKVGHDKVQFQQTTYLHLFAAKAAIADSDFLEELLQDPLFFSPIIGHYAALIRNSRTVVEEVSKLLSGEAPDSFKSGAFGIMEKREVPEHLSPSQENSEVPTETDAPSSGTTSSAHDDEQKEGDYDISNDADTVPFQLEDTSNLSPATQLSWSVDLVSRVLRDSDQLTDADLKNRVFADVLTCWGALIARWEEEEVFVEATRRIAKAMVEAGDLPEEKEEEVATHMALLLPAFTVVSGIGARLASRKLLVPYDNLLQNTEFMAGVYGPPMAACFAMNVGDSDWASRLPDLVKTHGNRWIVSDFLFGVMSLLYRLQDLHYRDEENILQFLVNRQAERHKFKSEQHKSVSLADYKQRMRKDRTLNTRRRLPRGTSPLEILGTQSDDD